VELVRKIRDIASDTADSSQTKKDLPIQFLSLSEPVDARVVIGGLGTSDAYDSSAFQLSIDRNPELAVPTVETERYGKKPEIHHIFKDSPSNPPIMITLAFVAMVGAALPVLAGLVRSYLVSWRQQQLTRLPL
jgi:oligosaccharyltransferase complex subunit delta (ribophorin II)